MVSAHAGYVPDAALVDRMRDMLVHRGPDGAGSHVGPGVGLGHRRLSIVDVAHGGQPMYSANRRFVVAYNGEIFNHPTLKPKLESQGVRYQTDSDTETLLHLFERHGDSAVDHMRGMFAFAVWDMRERRLVLGRDRFGVKPLYYLHQADGTLIFASEIKAVLEASGRRPSLNRAALPDYLANHAPSGEETLYEGVRRLPAGHTLTWHEGRIRLRQYWDVPYAEPRSTPVPGSSEERRLVDEFRARFTEAVRIRLMSDVPLGMFLSGGIDSAAITATMAELVDEPIRTFSVAFAEHEANELAYARMVSQRFGTEHREVIVTPEQFFEQLPRLTWHEDEPLAHPSSVPLFFVSELASRHVKVVLTGEGSDEMLAGYNRYRVTEYNVRLGQAYGRLVPGVVRSGVAAIVRGLPKASLLRQRAERTFVCRGADLDDLYFDNFAVFGRGALTSLLASEVRSELASVDPYAAYHVALSRVSGRPLLAQLLYADAKTYLHELLMKQDQMSMAASIESRVPFLDHPLAEWLSGLPPTMKLRGTTTKWILREAMAGRLPREILSRRKMGFPVPIGSWLRGKWRFLLDDVVLGSRAIDRGLFDERAVRQLVAEHLAGVNHTERLWTLLTFETWARVCLDGEAHATVRLNRAEAA
jgi:asparagine synthase (glutamine-hydrolysing)